jgi:hypothetical protein
MILEQDDPLAMVSEWRAAPYLVMAPDLARMGAGTRMGTAR